MKRIFYYLQVLPTLLTQVRSPLTILSKLLISKQSPILSLTDGARFAIRNTMDLWVLSEVYLRDDYGISNHLTKSRDKVIIDIGAGIGEFSILAARLNPLSVVYAIEPLHPSYNLLLSNIAINSLTNIKTFNLALSSHHQKLNLVVNHTNYGRSQTIQTPGARQVNAVSLHRFMLTNKIKHCDFLKCDCEGAEFDIFITLPSSSFQKIEKIAIEYHEFTPQHTVGQLTAILQQNGFIVETIQNPVHANTGLIRATKV